MSLCKEITAAIKFNRNKECTNIALRKVLEKVIQVNMGNRACFQSDGSLKYGASKPAMITMDPMDLQDLLIAAIESKCI